MTCEDIQPGVIWSHSFAERVRWQWITTVSRDQVIVEWSATEYIWRTIVSNMDSKPDREDGGERDKKVRLFYVELIERQLEPI